MTNQVSTLPRHSLASLFDPNSVLVITDQHLPVLDSLPSPMENNTQFILAQDNKKINLKYTLSRQQALAVMLTQQSIKSACTSPYNYQQDLDLVVICLPPDTIKDTLKVLEKTKPNCLLILRHSQSPDNAYEFANYCKQWGQENNCLIVGPNSFGVQRPAKGINFSLYPYSAPSGRVALVTQSTSIMAAVLDWAADISMGFSTLLSVGVDSPIDVSEVLDYLSMDNRTDSIVLHLEHPLSSRRFTSAMHAAASVKPVVVLKPGRHPVDHDPVVQQKAAISSSVLNALLRRVGAVRVRYFVQLFSALKVLVHSKRPKGRRIAIVANGQISAKLALDAMGPSSIVLPAVFNQNTVNILQQAIEPAGNASNPVVTRQPLKPSLLEQIMKAIVHDENVDGVLVLLAPDRYTDFEALTSSLAEIINDSNKPIISCFMGDAKMRSLRKKLDMVDAPAFRTPESAVEGFALLADYHYSQILAQQALPSEPLSWPPRIEQARALVQTSLYTGRNLLSAHEVNKLFQCFYIPIEHTKNIDETTYQDLPALKISMRIDKRYGPFIGFGASSTIGWVDESYSAYELPPLNRYLTRQLVQRSSLWRLLLEKKLSPMAIELIYESIERISDLVCEIPNLESILIDPLYVNDKILQSTGIEINIKDISLENNNVSIVNNFGYNHLAIHPYPRKLVQEKSFKNGDVWQLRPIRPEDAQALQDFIRGLSDHSRYMRFVSMLRELTPKMLARYTSIDYDRELALIATVTEPNPQHRGYPKEVIIGFAHYLRNPDGKGAEYALAISDDWQRHGLGASLMRELIQAAKQQGLSYIDGVVLSNNRPMLSLMSHLGFINDPDPDDHSVRRVWLNLK